MNKCSDCIHAKIVDEKQIKKEFECRRNPPSVQMFPAQDNFGRVALQKVTAWPSVAPEDYCGEFSPSPPKIKLVN